jgi:hypothetical protein
MRVDAGIPPDSWTIVRLTSRGTFGSSQHCTAVILVAGGHSKMFDARHGTNLTEPSHWIGDSQKEGTCENQRWSRELPFAN